MFKVNMSFFSTIVIKVDLWTKIIWSLLIYQMRTFLFWKTRTTIYMTYLICNSNRAYILSRLRSKYESMKKKLIEEQNLVLLSTQITRFYKFIRLRIIAIKLIFFFLFNNSIDYDLTLWFQKINCTKSDVTSFFKNERLESFRIDFEQLKFFRTNLSFKNEEEWLRQLNRITTRVNDDDWREQELIVKIEINEDFNMNMIVQYKDVNKTINFLLEHSSFALNLVYVSIR
jgi:hypothetical protein